jgi:hypothetical protein
VEPVIEVDGRTPVLARALSGSRSGRAALMMVQQEQLDSNHCENLAMGKEARPITGVTITALGKEMGVHL